ncbi:MAG: hypothetical protein DI539_11670 [Flavobacterium psychrophilum]|nr:MAG: hypothetical protein DI539_11670 [Flavobacterium psychrophilum]
MKLSLAYKNIIVETTSYLYIVLFVYAALSKLIQFDNFSIQLGQSPLIGAFALWLRWLVPVLELLIAAGLCIAFTKRLSLYLAFVLMCCFTTYIYIILNYSSYIPCSCGGILEKLNWKQHFIFNLVFLILAAVGLIAGTERKEAQTGNHYTNRGWVTFGLLFTFSACFGIVLLMYSSSERLISKENPFQRKFIPGSAREGNIMDLTYNTYYFAGLSGNAVYLGNSKAYQRITKIDTTLTKNVPYDVILPATTDKYVSLRLIVSPPFFYYYDGTVPEILRGSTHDWKLSETFQAPGFFNIAVMADSSTAITRNIDIQKSISYLSRHDLREKKASDSYTLLTQQIDGIFDCDGDMHIAPEMNTFVYVYRYRNQYLVTDLHLKLIKKGTTIDTNSIAKIRVATAKETGYTQLAAPPVIVNKFSAVSKNLLFVHSLNKGRLESNEMRKSASTIDVYDMAGGNYLASFYIYHQKGKKVRTFVVKGNTLYALVGSNLVKYHLGKNITSHYVN